MKISSDYRFQIISVIFPVLLLAVPLGLAQDYYVSPNGNDFRDGTSPQTAWKTLWRVSFIPPPGGFQSGDRILLEGGQIHNGSLNITPFNYAPTGSEPLVVGIYGSEERATIRSGLQFGIVVGIADRMHIENINLVGSDPAADNAGVVFRYFDGETYSNLSCRNMDITGYTYGIRFIPTLRPNVLSNIRIQGVKAYGNGGGVCFDGDRGGGFHSFRDVYVGHNEFYDNSGVGIPNMGFGLFAVGLHNAVIEHNIVRNNGGNSPAPPGGPNGASGITIYGGNEVRVEFNDVSLQRLTEGNLADNGGLDLWLQNSKVRYNKVYNIENWGFISLSDDIWPTRNMNVSYNFFSTNSQYRNANVGPHFLWHGNFSSVTVHNNVFYTPDIPDAVGRWPMIILSHAGDPHTNVSFRNNIFVTNGNVGFMDVGDTQLDRIVVQGNNFFGSTSAQKFIWGGVRYGDVRLWSDESGQEQENGRFIANLNDPRFCGPLGVDVRSFQLRSDSSLINAGLDLRRFGIDPGSRDFYGNPIPLDTGFDIGAHEFNPRNACDRGPVVRFREPVIGAVRTTLPILIEGDIESEVRIGEWTITANDETLQRQNSPTNNIFSHTWTPAVNGPYTIKASAKDANGLSNTATIDMVVAVPPEAPQGVVLSQASQTSFVVSWSRAPRALVYRLMVASDSGFNEPLSDYNDRPVGDVTQATVSNLKSNSLYYVRLRSENRAVYSAYSATAKIQTLGGGNPSLVPSTQFIQVRPNPVRGPNRKTMISGLKGDRPLKILNPQGLIVKEFKLVAESVEWDGTDEEGQRVPNGTYFGFVGEAPFTIVVMD